MKLVPGKLYEVKVGMLLFTDRFGRRCYEVYYGTNGDILMFVEEKENYFIFLLPDGKRRNVWLSKNNLTEEDLFLDYIRAL